jgi:hypothetical protein
MDMKISSHSSPFLEPPGVTLAICVDVGEVGCAGKEGDE